MRLEQLQYLVGIIDSGSFNKAAQALHITQPALTSAVKALENELGVSLLIRSSRGVLPTAYGRYIYEDGKELLREWRTRTEAWKARAGQGEAPSGVTPVVAIPTACNYIMEEIVYPLQARSQPIAISLHETRPDEMYAFLKQGRARIGITAFLLREKEAMLSQYHKLHFKTRRLLEDEYRVFLSARHELANKEVLTAEDCRGLSFATYSSEYNNPGGLFQTAMTRFSPQNVYYLNSHESIMAMIAQNKAAGFFLHRMTRNNWYMKNGLVCAKAVEGERLLPSEHYLLWLGQDALSGDEKTVVDFILRHYAKGRKGGGE